MSLFTALFITALSPNLAIAKSLNLESVVHSRELPFFKNSNQGIRLLYRDIREEEEEEEEEPSFVSKSFVEKLKKQKSYRADLPKVYDPEEFKDAKEYIVSGELMTQFISEFGLGVPKKVFIRTYDDKQWIIKEVPIDQFTLKITYNLALNYAELVPIDPGLMVNPDKAVIGEKYSFDKTSDTDYRTLTKVEATTDELKSIQRAFLSLAFGAQKRAAVDNKVDFKKVKCTEGETYSTKAHDIEIFAVSAKCSMAEYESEYFQYVVKDKEGKLTTIAKYLGQLVSDQFNPLKVSIHKIFTDGTLIIDDPTNNEFKCNSYIVVERSGNVKRISPPCGYISC